MSDTEPHRELSFLLGIDLLHRLSDDEKIAYIEERTTRMVLEAARNARAKALGEPAEEGRRIDSNLSLMTLICCSIEALGHFLAGRTPEKKRCETCDQPLDPQGGRADFRQFVDKYMRPYSPFSGILYDEFRSALAHGFAIPHGGITWDLQDAFIKGSAQEPHQVGFGNFIQELDRGVAAYFKEVREVAELREKFLRRWDYVHGFWIEQSKRRDSGSATSY